MITIEDLLSKQTEIVARLGIVKCLVMSQLVMQMAEELGWSKDQLVEFLKMFAEQGDVYQNLKNQTETSCVE